MGVGRPFAVYTAGRVALFALSVLGLSLVGVRGLPGVALALLLSSLLGLFVLRSQRDALTLALSERTSRRGQERARLRALLDSESGEPGGPDTDPRARG